MAGHHGTRRNTGLIADSTLHPEGATSDGFLRTASKRMIRARIVRAGRGWLVAVDRDSQRAGSICDGSTGAHDEGAGKLAVSRTVLAVFF